MEEGCKPFKKPSWLKRILFIRGKVSIDEKNIKTDCIFCTSDRRRMIGKRIVHVKNCCMYVHKKKIEFIFDVLRHVYVTPEHGSISLSRISKNVYLPIRRHAYEIGVVRELYKFRGTCMFLFFRDCNTKSYNLFFYLFLFEWIYEISLRITNWDYFLFYNTGI